MNDDILFWEVIYLLICMGVALGVSCCCSMVEAALLSLTPSQLANLRQHNARIWESCRQLKQNIDQPIAVILIVNTAANTIGATVAGVMAGAIFGSWVWLFSVVFTLLIVQYGEILPKTIGVRFNRSILRVAALPLQFLVWLLSPLVKISRLINRPFAPRLKEKGPSTAQEINALAAVARSSQLISSRQERIIRAVPRLSERTARMIMLPAENISFLSTSQTMAEALKATAVDFHTRYPVCENQDRNEVVGYVNFKELVATCQASPERTRLLDIVRPIGFAEPDATAADLLERFASQHCHMTIVRDEDGKTLGLVTMEDIVEELMGDLDDEFDPLPRTFYSPSDGFWVIGGGIPMTLLGRETKLDLPKRMEPVAVWCARELGHRPRPGDVFRYENVEFYVRKLRRGRVLEFNLKRVDHV